MGKSITQRITTACTGALAVLVLALVGMFASPPQAMADELTAMDLSAQPVQSAYTNTSMANAMELPYGRAYTGTFDYGSDGKFEGYWFKFKTSNRNSEYMVQIDSLNSKEIYFEQYDNESTRLYWDRKGAKTYYSTTFRATLCSSSTDMNSWYYVWIGNGKASRYDQYRVTVYEHRILQPENLTINPKTCTFNGRAQTPTVSVAYEGSVLTKDKDYNLVYINNTNAGQGMVKITGMGDRYTGEVSKTFAIKQKQADLSVELSQSKFTYNGYEQRPSIIVSDGYNELVNEEDYDLILPDESKEPGTYPIIVKCKNNYAGSTQVNYTIAKKTSSISLPNQTRTYDGKMLTYSKTPITKGSTGRITYRYYSDVNCTMQVRPMNLIDAGVYYVKAWLAEDEHNTSAVSKPAKFTIAKKAIAIPKAKTGLVYNGKVQQGVAASKHYSITGNKATKAGSYEATLTANRNYIFANDESKVTVKWNMAKATQKVSGKSVSASFKGKKSGRTKVLATNRTIDLKAKANVSAKTAVEFEKANRAGGSKITVHPNTGKVTLHKGLRKGTYKVNVRISTSLDENYKIAYKTITLTVKAK